MLAAAGLAAAGLAVTACGPANPVASGAVPAPTPPATHQAQGPARPAAPLTGAPAASAAVAARPAVAVVVAGPNPRGLADADVVFQEMTTPERFIAVYQSRSASAVGPVTSTQPTDREALAVLHPLIAYDGAAAKFFISMLDKSTVTDVGHRTHPTLYRTTPGGGLITSTRAITKAVHGGTAPPSLFQYGKAGRLAGRQWAARSVRLVIPGNGTQEWAFSKSADRWALTRGGPRVQVANLAIEWVPYRQLGVGAHARATVSSAQVVGKGKAEVLSGGSAGSSDGMAAVGTWSKPLTRGLTNFFDASFSPMTFQPGPTWVIFAPPGTHVSTSR